MCGAAGKLKRLSLAAGLLLGASAQGIADDATFPVDGVYGTEVSCALYWEGGVELAASDATDGEGDPLITPEAFVGHEFGCEPSRRSSADSTIAQCWAEGDRYTWDVRVTQSANAADELTISIDDYNAFAVSLCVKPSS